jgi:hypothetical protein
MDLLQIKSPYWRARIIAFGGLIRFAIWANTDSNNLKNVF